MDEINQEIQTTELPNTATAVADPPAEPPKPPDAKDRRAVVEHAFKNPSPRGQHAKYQPRGEQGKFAGAPEFPKPNVASAPPVPRPDMPKSWNLELKSHWDAAPVELLNRFVQREQESERGLQPFRQAKQQLDELMNLFEPYKAQMASQQATPQTAIQNYLQTVNLLQSGDPTAKAQLLANLIRQYQIPVQSIGQFLSGTAPAQPQPTVLDPRVQQLTQQVEQLTQSQKRESENRALSAINRFAADPANKHFDALQPRILALLKSPEVIGDDEFDLKSDEDKLRLAYDFALRMDPQIYQQVLAEQQQAALAQQQVNKAKQATVQIKGGPAAGPAPTVNPQDRRAVIANAFRRT